MFLIVLAFIGIIIAIPFLVVDSGPTVSVVETRSPVQIDRAKALLRRNDPRQMAPGALVTQWIAEDEMSLISSYLLGQNNLGAAIFQLHPGRAFVEFSLNLPANPLGSHINSKLIMTQAGSTLRIESLRLGSITIPGWAAEFLRGAADKALRRIPEYASAIESLNGLQLLEDRMLVAYQWRPEILSSLKQQGQSLLVDEATRERLLAYSKQINAVAARPGTGIEMSLTEFLTPMFFLAEARGGDPVEENRAALLALSFYFSGVDVARMLGVDIPGTRETASKRLTLSGRYDFTQHFLTSAALTVTTGFSLADTVGLFKELDDAKGGSGFSFTDIGADRAGVRFAQMAIASPQTAARLQDFLTGRVKEEDIIPNFLDLPERLTDEEFESRYGGVGGPAYNRIMADIEARIDRCALYQEALHTAAGM